MKQYGFFDEHDRLKELSKPDDPSNGSIPAWIGNNSGEY
jgi:hypothetical protein